MIAAIAAVDNNWGIGYKGKLLESIPNDLKHFKKLTDNNVVVMGSRTWESLPNKPLPNRTNIIVTHNIKDSENPLYIDLDNLKKWLSCAKRDVFIIGGGQIYKQLLPFCERVYLTKIYKNYKNVDTYFPNLDQLNSKWAISSKEEILIYNNLFYQFLTYDKIS